MHKSLTYFAPFIDDKFSWIEALFLKPKDAIKRALMIFKARALIRSGNQVGKK